MPLAHRNRVRTALAQQLQHALVLAVWAEAAYHYGARVWAGTLAVAAERAYSEIFDPIAALTEEEAELLEPAVTRVEKKLIPFSRLQAGVFAKIRVELNQS